MKKIYLSTLLTFFALTIFGQAPQNGLVAYYKMDGNTNDETGVNNGTQQGGVNFTTASDRFGIVGKAIGFDGVNDYINCGNSLLNGLNNYTISSWIKSNTNSAIGAIYSKESITIPQNQFRLTIQNSEINFLTCDNNVQNNLWSNTGGYVLKVNINNDWNCITIKRDGNNFTIYLNGNMVVAVQNTQIINYSNINDLYLGANRFNGSPATFFNGSLDDIRIYNRALTDTEVNQLYQAEAPPIDITTGLVAHYKMDGDAQDASGNGNHGTQQGGVNFAGVDRFGFVGKAAEFDSFNRILINHSSTLNLSSSFSFSFWIKAKTWKQFGYNASGLVSKITHAGNGFYLQIDGVNYTALNFRLKGDLSISNTFTYNELITDEWEFWSIIYDANSGQKLIYKNLEIEGGSVVQHGDISNLSPLTIGYSQNNNIGFNGLIDDLRIYNRALTQEQLESLYQAQENIGQFKVTKLPEDIYESVNTVLQQSIVHRYYILKDNVNNLPQAGLKVKYSLSNKPNQYFYSTLSNDKGLVDLMIKTGGEDNTITSDDLILANQLSLVSFVGIEQNGITQTVTSSEFGVDDFGISVYATAEPEEKEYGISGGFAVGVGVGAKAGINLGGVEVSAGVASYKIGTGLGGGMLITPEHNNPNKWDVELDLDTEYFLEASVGPEVDAEIPEIVTYSLGASANGKLSGGERQKFGYKIDLDSSPNQNLYQLAHQILLLKSREYPNLLRASNFFKRMSAISIQKTTVGVGYGAAANLDANAGMGLSASFFNDENISTGLGLVVAGGGEIAIETINTYDLENFTNVHENKITVGTSASAGLEIINGYDYGEDTEVEAVIPLPQFFSNSRNYSLTMAREMFGTGVRNLEATYGSSTIKNIAGKEVEVEYSYTSELNQSLTQKLISSYKNNQTKANTFADFVTFGKTSETSMFSLFPASSNFFTHYIDFNKMASRLHADSQGLDAISQKVDRYYTRKVGGEIPFSGTLFLELSFDLNLEGWTTYKNPLAEYKYVPSVQRILPVLDRPDNDLFIKIPQNDPFTIVWDKVQTALSNEAQNVVNQAYGFVNKTFENVSSSIRKFYTNLGFNQLSLNATSISTVKPIVEKGILSTTPSVLTFDVPPAPAAFVAGTEIRFSFYYPENLLKAKIGVDTFQIITDVFYLNAISNGSRLVNSPNGNFNVVTQFSAYDLQRTSLPLGSVVKVIFLPEDSKTWEIFDEVNQTKGTNRLGVYAIAAKLEYDKTSPTIQITNPTTTNQLFEVSISETQSGINWANTVVIVNGNVIPFQRTIGSNIIQANLFSIPVPSDGVYNFEIRTSDLSNNSAVAKSLYPCESNFKINSVTSSLPKQYKALGLIESTAALPSNSQVDFKSEKAIILNPGFEIRGGKTFKAEIGGCQN